MSSLIAFAPIIKTIVFISATPDFRAPVQTFLMNVDAETKVPEETALQFLPFPTDPALSDSES